ncbi:MAG TPA: rhodanese-like domain-containing protein, partial [Rhodanobacteraceae bacterium]|nr:rhodanese-like domain-containing protein [Rhodanobacteraceae bacterium]
MSLREIPPREALQHQRAGALLLDVRETFEHATGLPENATPLPRGDIAQHIAEVAPDASAEILTICAHGQRSLMAARLLQQMGYANVASVAGGTARWIEEGLPMAKPGGDEDFYDRYSRHLR